MFSERTQRIGALVVYNLSCPDSSETAKTVMDIGVTQTLSAVVKQPSVETKFWAAAALCNLSWDLAYAARLVQEGAVSVLRELLTRADASSGAGADDRNDEIYLQCVTALYNMAQGSGKTDEKLVEDGAVPLLESLLETTDPTILELACVALYNISTVEECDVQMVEDQVASCLMKVLLRFTPPLDAEGFESFAPRAVGLLLDGERDADLAHWWCRRPAMMEALLPLAARGNRAARARTEDRSWDEERDHAYTLPSSPLELFARSFLASRLGAPRTSDADAAYHPCNRAADCAGAPRDCSVAGVANPPTLP